MKIAGGFAAVYFYRIYVDSNYMDSKMTQVFWGLFVFSSDIGFLSS